MKTLILGGVRSGKSRLAERLAIGTGQAVTYIATATAGDEEMSERIQRHRARRPDHWRVIEEPLRLGDAINGWQAKGGCLLIDCVTLWLTNLLVAADRDLLHKERSLFLEALSGSTGEIIVVSNENSMGVTPLGEVTRAYLDIAGEIHQQLAQSCDRVVLTVAGLPCVLKGDPVALD